MDHTLPSLTSAEKYLRYKLRGERIPSYTPPDTVIFIYQRSFFDRLLQLYPTTQCDGYFDQTYFLDDHPGVAFGFYGVGAPVCAVRLEQLRQWGVKRFFTVGTAGSLQKEVVAGDLVVVDRAIRDEGVSKHYMPPGRDVSVKATVVEGLEKSMREMGNLFRTGTVRTTDAFYRQPVSLIKRLQEEGVLCVEMEAASLLAIALHFGFPLGVLLVVSDELGELNWSLDFDGEKVVKGLQTLFETAIRASIMAMAK